MLFLIILQTTLVTILGIMQFIFAPPISRLPPLGWIVIALLYICLTSTTIAIYIDNAEAQKRIKDLVTSNLERAMTTPAGPILLPPPPTGEALHIEGPPDGFVDTKTIVRGSSSERVEQLWVVVHPLDTSSYWIQPRVSISRSGEWEGEAYFGRGGAIDVGKKFEVLAVGNPEIELTEGMIFDRWPASRLVSNLITVTRR